MRIESNTVVMPPNLHQGGTVAGHSFGEFYWKVAISHSKLICHCGYLLEYLTTWSHNGNISSAIYCPKHWYPLQTHFHKVVLNTSVMYMLLYTWCTSESSVSEDSKHCRGSICSVVETLTDVLGPYWHSLILYWVCGNSKSS